MALAVFDISPPVVNGIAVKPVEDQTSGTIRCVSHSDAPHDASPSSGLIRIDSHPKPFKCTIHPRSDRALALIHGEIHQ